MRPSQNATALCVFIVTAMLSLGATDRAEAQIHMKIVGPSGELSPIAVPALKDLGGDGDHALSSQFVDTLSRDLKLSGYFRIIEPQAYIEDSQNSGYQFGQFNWGNWSSINAVFLVKGAVSSQADGITVEAYLYDVPRQQQLSGKRFSGS